ncbi:hypothetical protein BAUCODRAFT_26871 [Baudoinia panamericana UAMH 10762]|uniref:Protein kinase domain-containing protein n=1 Tax=Baudoinia panamericana (strain UAMH 10762) TaxID=717646 RepID=M2MAY9_BAUPA|nr:uncharacterized protein BAUCODRAFT_26871 [Baudoinia panamericana UAMH 10762]EMC93631.1 hypothetical protein BAUCODRAFT_26871 [Baudoinia panamericana UAMH 10762]
MPHLFPFASHGHETPSQEMEHDSPHSQPRRRPSLLKNLGSLLRRHHGGVHEPDIPQTAPTEQCPLESYFPPPGVRRRSFEDQHAASRKAIPSLPRPQTFRRQESERRERLLEVAPTAVEKRALSVDRRQRVIVLFVIQLSALLFYSTVECTNNWSTQSQRKCCPKTKVTAAHSRTVTVCPECHFAVRSASVGGPPLQLSLRIPDSLDPTIADFIDERSSDHELVQEEYERCWILNLSMQFRDKSSREKFFVTYAEKPNRWRRLTVSLDYRTAPEGSLEADLSSLPYQRDKSFRIFEAIRESLPEIEYYDTVTNLKLETAREDGQLHVHVREDANEIIQFPSLSLFQHIDAPLFRDSHLDFIGHLSGFVYKVLANDKVVIKKDIPGRDTVDEFLYEVNALDSLTGCKNVVQLEGLVTDDSGTVVKGVLIAYASNGALVDMLYDYARSPELPWHRREKWAKQIVTGLSNIHEAGYVQGDFTLSNIVIDTDDNAVIIDINRRGCPVGWEPPELGRLIDSGQRISMCIGVKTDLFQLGMVLWALAEEVDEPERIERPLPALHESTPEYYQRVVDACLDGRPQGRTSAKDLLRFFPPSAGRPRSVDFNQHVRRSDDRMSPHCSEKRYIDPEMAMTLDEVRGGRIGSTEAAADIDAGVTYLEPGSGPASTGYQFGSSGSWVVGRRGRSPVSSKRRKSSPFGRTATSSRTSVSPASPMRTSKDKDNNMEHELPYPPVLREEDLHSSLGTLLQSRTQPPAPYPSDKRLTSVRDDDVTTLIHTDSGFDEQMIEELQVEDRAATGSRHAEQAKAEVQRDGSAPRQQ